MAEREIEEVLKRHLIPHHVLGGRQLTIADIKLSDLVAELVALRAQDREDGAHEMRERAAACCREEADNYDSRHEYDDGFLQGCKESARLIEALPLSPARKDGGDA